MTTPFDSRFNQALESWRHRPDRPTAWSILDAAGASMASPGSQRWWPLAETDEPPPHFEALHELDDAQSPLSALKHLSWFDHADVRAYWVGRQSDEWRRGVPNPWLGTDYDLLWLDVRSRGGVAVLPEASLRRFREQCIFVRADEDPLFASHLRSSLVVMATLHGAGMLLPDLIVAGPTAAQRSDQANALISVLVFPMSREARRGDSTQDISGRVVAAMSHLVAGGDWRRAFQGVGGDLRSLYRDATRRALEEVMQVLQQGAGVRAETKDEARILREAATLVLFRVLFLMEAERRGLLYADGAAPPDGIPSLAELAAKDGGEEALPSGSLLRRLGALTRGVRAEAGSEAVALRGASIFGRRPSLFFAVEIEQWLAPIELAEPAFDTSLLQEWDRVLAHVAAVASGQVNEHYAQVAGRGAVGFGGAEHAQRVLGDVYEQILAMEPKLGSDGRVTLAAAGGGTDERRALGAHYTPEDIVAEVVWPTLGAIFAHHWEAVGHDLHAYRTRIAALRVLDPAMGSAHFLTVAALEIARELAWIDVIGRPQPPEYHERLALDRPDHRLPDDDAARAAVLTRVRELIPAVVRTSCYGVDINALAVELGKLSLWLFTMTVQHAERPELTFVDGNIRVGDSLAGLTFDQARATLLERVDPDLDPTSFQLFGSQRSLAEVRNVVAEVHAAMRRPRGDLLAWLAASGVSVPVGAQEDAHLLRQALLSHAQSRLDPVAWVYDLALLAELHDAAPSGAGARRLVRALSQSTQAGATVPADLAILVRRLRDESADQTEQLRDVIKAAAREARALHWELAFPDVFATADPGFDAIVTNPPFIGDKKLRGRIGKERVAFLQRLYTDGDTPDYSGFFVLRYDQLLKETGAVFGTLGPNTLAQAKTRRVALVPLFRARGNQPARFRILRAVRSLEWPGDAAVYICQIVAVRHGVRGQAHLALDVHESDGTHARVLQPAREGLISSFLDDLPDEDPAEIPSMSESIAYQGMIPRGGFQRPLGLLAETPVSERDALTAFLNTDTVQHQPKPVARKVAIDFYTALERHDKLGMSAEDEYEWLSGNYPFLMSIVRATVGTSRAELSDEDDDEGDRERWWLFARPRIELRSQWRGYDRVIAIPRVVKVWSVLVLSKIEPESGLQICPMDKLCIISLESLALPAVLSAFTSEVVVRRMSSTLKTDLNVTPTDSFPGLPLPWPAVWNTARGRPWPFPAPSTMEVPLGTAIQRVFDWRGALLVDPGAHGLTGRRRPGGPTDLYNLYDDPRERCPSIEHLRELHRDLLNVVLAAYGWDDVRPTWDFDRPWIDGYWRYVPSADDRREMIRRLTALAGERRRMELDLSLEHLLPLLPNRATLAQVAAVARSGGLRLSDDELVATLALGGETGALLHNGDNWATRNRI